MKTFKSVISVLLVLLMVFCFTACHTQNEVAVTVGDIKFTSAMYSYALFSADNEAKTLVDEKLAETATEENPVPETVDYFAQTIEEKSYVTWVEERALELLRDWAAYETLCKENNLTLDEEEISEIESYAQYYYSYYGSLFSANGIGEETYTKMMYYDSYANEYFDFLYGKDGSKAIPQEDVTNSFKTSYRVALVLQTDVTQMEEADATAAKTKLEEYRTKLEGGASVVDVYNEFNNLTEESAATTGYSPVKEVKECASIIADPDVDESYGVDFFKDIKDMAAGEVKIMDAQQDGSKFVRLVLIIDSESDASYLENMDASIRWNLKNEEYTADVSTYGATLKVTKNKYAMNAFKVKDINYGE